MSLREAAAIECPHCGFYCIGNGGLFCIHKHDLYRMIEEQTMNPWRNYIKNAKQPMRPYIPGEDLTGISVWDGDTPEEGGMIAMNPKNSDDQWYVAKKFFEENYIEAVD